MGAHTSSLRNTLADAFDSRSDGRHYVGLCKLITLSLPKTSWSVDHCHLGVLFMLDSDHDGLFSKDDLFRFLDLAASTALQHPSYEFRTHLQGYCTGQLWAAMALPGTGKQKFVKWITALVEKASETDQPRRFKRHGAEPFVGMDAVQAMHTIFNIQENMGLNFQEFFDLLQRAGEERGLMDITDNEQDDYVPLSVIGKFAGEMYDGIHRFVGEILHPVQHLETATEAAS